MLISLRSGEGPAPALVLIFAPAIVLSLLGRLFLSVEGLRGWLSVPEVLALVLLAGVLGACASPFNPPMAAADMHSSVLASCCVLVSRYFLASHIQVGAEKRGMQVNKRDKRAGAYHSAKCKVQRRLITVANHKWSKHRV